MIAARGSFSLSAALRFRDSFALAGTPPQGAQYEAAQVVAGEPRLASAVAEHYGLAAPRGDAELAAIAAAWSPFRAWAAFLRRVDAAG